MNYSTEEAEQDVENANDELRRGKKGTKDFQRRAVVSNLLTIVEFVLSLVNAVKREGFQFSTPTQFVFGASAAMKLVGLLFAFCLALEAYSSADYRFGNGGSPLAMVWKATRKNDDSLMRKSVIHGFGAQAVAVWASCLVYLFVSDAGIFPVGGLFMASGGVVRIVCYAWQRHGQLVPKTPSESSTAMPQSCSFLALGHLIVLLVLLLVPLTLEAVESVLLFSKSGGPQDVVLAVIDVFLAFGAMPFVCSFLGTELPYLWESVTSYRA